MKNPNRYFKTARVYARVRSIGVALRASHFFALTLLASAFGCAASGATNRTTSTPSPIVNEPASASNARANDAHATETGAKPLPQAVSALAAEGVTGVIALFDSQSGSLYCSDEARCAHEYLPASTFKVPLTAIALETGIVSDAETVLPWDGKPYSNPDWNRDNTLRSAVQTSCEPCFREIAHKIGTPTVHEWLTRFDYGNRDTSGGSELFWLRGALRITPLQQIDFLRRLDAGKLPLSEHTLDVLRDVITLDVTPDYVLRGKTGSAQPPDESMEISWFVGFVELGARRVFFATALDGHSPGIDPLQVRRRVTEHVLHDIGDLPAQ